MVELIITEKPSSAQKIATALADSKPILTKSKQSSYFTLTHKGKEIIVTSAVGHLYGLAEKENHHWAYPVFDIEWVPAHKMSSTLKYTKDYIDTISAVAKKADEFTIACDYDVEGEVIGLNVIRFACKQKDSNRMKFSTLTTEDLVESYENKINHLDWGQANAGETRHKLDWFYGINISRALTSSVKSAGAFKVMSAGRVQGPALKLLVDREKEINKFVPESFWEIQLLGDYKKTNIEAWHEKDKIFDKAIVEKILATVKGKKEAIISTVTRTKRNQSPPNPFDLTSLQSESYNLFKITPKDTLAIAQKLYLAGVTSYPRTSSQQLDPKLGFQNILNLLSKQEEYKDLCKRLLKLPKLTPNNGKKTDPAHPAIYPTGQAPKSLLDRENKIYDLIVKRFMATFGTPAVRETMEVVLDVNHENFITKGTRTLEENWYVFYKPYVKVEEITLPDMKEKDVVDISKISKIDKETQPPNRYNQSSIIKELEKRNLGTKATRADILDRLFQRGYVEGVQIKVTQLGIETIDILEKFVGPIVDEKLTADFEEEMEKIREGKSTEEKVLEKAKKSLTELLTDFKKKEKIIGQEILKSIRTTIDQHNFMGQCPKCKEGKLMVRRGKFGRFVGCDKYPECNTILNIPKTGVVKFTEKQCDKCGYPIVEAGKGRSKRTNCLNQNCPTLKSSQEEKGKAYKEEGMECPTCKKGQMVLRKSFYGAFLGCNNYPACKTMMKINKEGKVEVDKPIVKTGDSKKEVVKKKTTKKKTVSKKTTNKKIPKELK